MSCIDGPWYPQGSRSWDTKILGTPADAKICGYLNSWIWAPLTSKYSCCIRRLLKPRAIFKELLVLSEVPAQLWVEVFKRAFLWVWHLQLLKSVDPKPADNVGPLYSLEVALLLVSVFM